ncbi:hypothetical protein BDV97DRAFT_355514 [Delphinella strobiligena]|nr:hypothetical protein BDV97DRAFT_355514 [Delphinella strobiligena]
MASMTGSTLSQNVMSFQRPNSSIVLPPPPPFPPAQKDASEMVDEEGTPDVIRLFVDELLKDGAINCAIEEPESIDWLLEAEEFPRLVARMHKEPMFMPRKGEIVIFARISDEELTIRCDMKDRRYKLWSPSSKSWRGTPVWEAGVVTQASVPTLDVSHLAGPVKAEDHPYANTFTGFRVEPLPQFGNPDKTASKRHAYVPLHQLRPFIFWKEFMCGVEATDFHVTIKHAIDATSTLSLVNKYWFQGKGSEATVYCSGVYLGHELILLGDFVRLCPRSTPSADTHSTYPLDTEGVDFTQVIEVMRIRTIELKLHDIGSNEEIYGVMGSQSIDLPPWTSSLHVSGEIITTDPTKAVARQRLASRYDLEAYGPWYNTVPPGHKRVIPFSRIIGRCYEGQAMTRWFSEDIDGQHGDNAKAVADLSKGVKSHMDARALSVKSHPALSAGRRWYIADNRVEQLDLHEVKGEVIGRHGQFGGETRNADQVQDMMKAMKARGYKGSGGRSVSWRYDGVESKGIQRGNGETHAEYDGVDLDRKDATDAMGVDTDEGAYQSVKEGFSSDSTDSDHNQPALFRR